jgi:3-deoxy-7-phosphoheptulonate synthase
MQNRSAAVSDAPPPAVASDELPAPQQPMWRRHPAFTHIRYRLASAAPLVSLDELATLRLALAEVSAGRARVLQAGDCAESFYECTHDHTEAKVRVLEMLADHMSALVGQPVVRIGRMGGQYAKPRSRPVEQYENVSLPSFRGHLVNSEEPSRAAREHDPRRMLWAYEASARVLSWVGEQRARRSLPVLGPWSSHEALVVDYEAALLRTDAASDQRYLGSTHLPWIGERTRQPDGAHVHMLREIVNPVGCKIGPGAQAVDVVRLAALLDPHRTPGRLVLIVRMGVATVEEGLPPIVDLVRRAGHPAVWLCDPMHGNTVTSATGLKTRRLDDMVAEADAFHRILEARGVHPGGLHLEAAGTEVTECIGGPVVDELSLSESYTTLCDPRLNVSQAAELIERVLAPRPLSSPRSR